MSGSTGEAVGELFNNRRAGNPPVVFFNGTDLRILVAALTREDPTYPLQRRPSKGPVAPGDSAGIRSDPHQLVTLFQ